MITEEIKKKSNERMAEICRLHGIEDIPSVDYHGPFTGKFILPSTWSSDQMFDVTSEFADVEWVAGRDGMFLGAYYDGEGEEFSDEEARTFIFDVDKAFCVFRGSEMKAHEAEHVIKIKDEWANNPDNVVLTLRHQFFDEIQAGRKKVEYREYKECWVKRLLGPKAKYVTFQRGYAKNAEKMVFKVDRYELEDADGRIYSPWNMPPMPIPETILIHLDERVL
ncbi:MAG: hypothetical protein MJZ81_09245 [Bacteroidales bacterium]|nr:hypothetical protein [Bacteroidales bacterium]